MRRLLRTYFPAALCAAAISTWAQVKPVPTLPPEPEEVRERFSTDEKDVTVRKFGPGHPNPPGKSRTGGAPPNGWRSEIRAFGFADELLGRQMMDRPLIVRTGEGEPNPKVVEQLQEDLSVMARILDKTTEEHVHGFDGMKAAGIEIRALAGRGRSDRALYIEGFGVIFTLNVNMPLQIEAEEEKVEEKEPVRNEEWEDARNELYGAKRRGGSRRGAFVHGPTVEQDDIDEFRDGLVRTLKNAANIRNLSENDSVLVVVRGGSSMKVEERELFPVEGEGKQYALGARVALDESRGSAATMVLRARYGDLAKASNDDILKRAVKVSIY